MPKAPHLVGFSRIALFAAACALAPATPAIAGQAVDQDVESAADPEGGATAQQRVDLKDESTRPLGWLSDPDEPAADPFEALVGGKVHFNNRFRLEVADTSLRDSATALTNRLRLGYASKPYAGFSGLVEMENVIALVDDYFVPATGDGPSGRTVIADPDGMELNQLYGRFSTDALAEADVSLDLRAGRQRILLDNQRFVGNVGWRQFEQTYDAVRISSDLGVERLNATYAYIWGVERIFGPDGPSPDSDSHLINASFRAAPELTITPFAYLLDFKRDEPLNSSDSFGVRLTGELGRDAGDAADVYFDYELTYARQTDAGDNPVDYEADYFAAEVGLSRADLGTITIGYQLLGSDDGEFGFRFPLGTNHAFQGFADNFLTTPADGLQDLYFGVSAPLPWEVRGSAIVHQFWSDEGGRDLGVEFNLVASKAINSNWSVLVKGAFLDGNSGQPDVMRLWLQTEVRF